MTRSRDFSRILGRSIANNTFTTTGSISASGGVTAHDYTTVADFVDAEANAAALEDGSLHYLTKLRKMYVWDDSDASFYLVAQSGTALPESWKFYGSTSGYSSGGNAGRNVIDKYPFSSDANAADVGDLILSRQGPSGQSSSASGYSSGGTTPTYQNVIDKFSFSSDGNATDVGDLILPIALSTGNSSENYGYVSLGWSPSFPPPGTSNVIQKFPFASDANSADVGDTIGDRRGAGGQNSSTHGYVSGGVSSAYTADINKFSFTTDGNATDVGDATGARGLGTGQSSSTHGYNSGGVAPSLGPPAYTNSVDKFPFASDANATDVGDLTAGRALTPASQSSTVSGYTSGGNAPTAGGTSDIIDKFPFSSDANATDVGDLTVARQETAGQQV